MDVPQNHTSGFSPAAERFNKMRREGTCVTARHDLSNAQHPVVPADPHNLPPAAAKLPAPDDESMPDA